MKNTIRMPVRVDANERVIPDGDTTTRVWRWRLNIPASMTGTRKERRYFKTRGEAMMFREGLLASCQAMGGDIFNRLKARGMSVVQAIEYTLKHAARTEPVRVSTAIERFIASRVEKNCKRRYLANLKSQLADVAEQFGSVMVDTVSKVQLEVFLQGLTAKDGDTPASPKTRINYIITLSALFGFAVEEGWRGENPAAKLRRPKRDEVMTAVLTPDQARRLLAEGSKPQYADVFPLFAIQLFAGPRRSELPWITWELIRDKYLRLDKSKVRSRRPVELPEALLKWIEPYRGTDRVFAPAAITFDPADTRPIENAYTYRISEIAEASGVILPKNVLRHTALTYRVNFTGNIEATAEWGGTSAAVIRSNYLGAATPADAQVFYSLGPEAM